MRKRAYLYIIIMLTTVLLNACSPRIAAIETVQSSEPLAPPSAAMTQVPASEPDDETFVRVADDIPDVIVDLKYATDKNFTGQTIYDFQDAYLRYGTVKKLSAAADKLRGPGLQ